MWHSLPSDMTCVNIISMAIDTMNQDRVMPRRRGVGQLAFQLASVTSVRSQSARGPNPASSAKACV